MRRLALLAAALLLAGCAGDDAKPPKLTVYARYPGGGYAEIDEDWGSLPRRFVLAPGVSSSARLAPGYELGGDLGPADAQRMARTLGLESAVSESDYGWSAGSFTGDGLGLSVGKDGEVSLSMYLPPVPCNDTFSGAATDDAAFAASCAAPTTTTLVPPKALPSPISAERTARQLARDWGVDVAGVPTKTTVGESAVRVRFLRSVGGLLAKGFEFVIEVDGNGVSGAGGFLTEARYVAEYELTSVEHALHRLNVHIGSNDPEAEVVRLRSVELGLMITYDELHNVGLQPAYVFTDVDGRTVAAPAVRDEYFEEPGN